LSLYLLEQVAHKLNDWDYESQDNSVIVLVDINIQ